MTKEDIAKLLEAIEAAYKKAGKKLDTAVLYDEENEDGKLIVDNREEGDVN